NVRRWHTLAQWGHGPSPSTERLRVSARPRASQLGGVAAGPELAEWRSMHQRGHRRGGALVLALVSPVFIACSESSGNSFIADGDVPAPPREVDSNGVGGDGLPSSNDGNDEPATPGDLQEVEVESSFQA